MVLKYVCRASGVSRKNEQGLSQPSAIFKVSEMTRVVSILRQLLMFIIRVKGLQAISTDRAFQTMHRLPEFFLESAL